MSNQGLDDYLTTLERSLSALPAERRQEELTEIRQHLRAAVNSYRETGLNEEDAVAQVLRQFGAPERVGKGIRQAFRRGRSSWRDTELCAVITAVFASTLPSAVFTLCCLLLYPNLFLNDVVRATENSHYFVVMVGISFLMNLLTGLITGLVTPRYAVRGTLIAFLITRAFTWLQTAIMEALHPSFVHKSPFMNPYMFAASVLSAGVSLTFCLIGARIAASSRRVTAG